VSSSAGATPSTPGTVASPRAAGPAIPRPAATLVLLRDTAHGPEVLLLQRSPHLDFMAGAFVFPGGGVDATDRDPAIAARCIGLDDAQASARLGLDAGGLAYYVAAIRETFEEAGLLLGYETGGQLLDLQPALEETRFLAHRRAVHDHQRSLLEVCTEESLTLATDRIAYLSHWITPVSEKKRYDTRFFVAAVPENQASLHDDIESVSQLWIRPAEAVAMKARGELLLRFPTLKTLETLASFASTEEALHWVRNAGDVRPLLPWIARRRGQVQRILPGEPGYDEAQRVNPAGSELIASETTPGAVTALSTRVRRIVAPNPGVMTGPGTNSYIVGDAEVGDLAIIDPGPVSDAHLEVLLAQVGQRLRWIVCTHTHLDHSPGVVALKAATGAQSIGMPPPPHSNQDQTFVPDRVFADGERLQVGGCTLRAVHTPGHASNHLCWFLEEERLLFTGDHIMSGSTVVISPPDGDMAAYLAALEKLLAMEIEVLAPGHGYLITRPRDAVRALIAHRLKREAKVADALAAHGEAGATLDQLVPVVYADTPASLHPVARRSLHAHLLKLLGDGRAIEHGGRWQTR
jgi:glyoxylase-like metal-dependent hydrolase (beta-lactamase superfamily II)/8-oxo-dGTP pyrophosphatase MutT (NUDIX family)